MLRILARTSFEIPAFVFAMRTPFCLFGISLGFSLGFRLGSRTVIASFTFASALRLLFLLKSFEVGYLFRPLSAVEADRP